MSPTSLLEPVIFSYTGDCDVALSAAPVCGTSPGDWMSVRCASRVNSDIEYRVSFTVFLCLGDRIARKVSPLEEDIICRRCRKRAYLRKRHLSAVTGREKCRPRTRNNFRGHRRNTGFSQFTIYPSGFHIRPLGPILQRFSFDENQNIGI